MLAKILKINVEHMKKIIIAFLTNITRLSLLNEYELK